MTRILKKIIIITRIFMFIYKKKKKVIIRRCHNMYNIQNIPYPLHCLYGRIHVLLFFFRVHSVFTGTRKSQMSDIDMTVVWHRVIVLVVFTYRNLLHINYNWYLLRKQTCTDFPIPRCSVFKWNYYVFFRRHLFNF